jgi:hypothetical protein
MIANSPEYSYKARLPLKFHIHKYKGPRHDISIEEFTNVFIEEGCLDKYNTINMIYYFNKGREMKIGDKILWGKDLLSLLTIIFLVCEFKSLKIPLPIKIREHTNVSTTDKDYLKGDFTYLPLINNYFKFKKKEKYSESAIHRNWNYIKNASNKYIEKYIEEVESIPKKTTEECFYFEALAYYLDNPKPLGNEKTDDPKKAKISHDMLEIFCRISESKPIQ